MVFWRSMKTLVIFVVVFTLMYIWKKYIKHMKPGMHWLMVEGSCLPRSPRFLSPVLLKLVFSNLSHLLDTVTSEIPHNRGLENDWLNQDTETDGLHLGLVFASHFVLLGSRDSSTIRKEPQQKGTDEDRVSEEQALPAGRRCPPRWCALGARTALSNGLDASVVCGTSWDILHTQIQMEMPRPTTCSVWGGSS